jgi:hypothetical protein
MKRPLSKNPEKRPMPGPLGKMLYGRFPFAMLGLAFNQAGARPCVGLDTGSGTQGVL